MSFRSKRSGAEKSISLIYKHADFPVSLRFSQGNATQLFIRQLFITKNMYHVAKNN